MIETTLALSPRCFGLCGSKPQTCSKSQKLQKWGSYPYEIREYAFKPCKSIMCSLSNNSNHGIQCVKISVTKNQTNKQTNKKSKPYQNKTTKQNKTKQS